MLKLAHRSFHFETGSEKLALSSWISNLLAFRLEFTPLALLVLRPLDLDWNYTIGYPESAAR